MTVMRTLLFKRSDYDKLAKLSFAETAKYLQESNYKREIDELALELKGADLLETALNQNLVRTFAKLRKISPPQLNLLIDAYMKKNDILNLKTVIRAKYQKLGFEEMKRLLIPAGIYSQEYYERLMALDSVEKVISSIELLDAGCRECALKQFAEKHTLTEVENQLDRAYIESVFKFTKRLPVQGRLFREFLMYGIDISNLKLILRLKKEGVAKEEIQKHIIMSGKILNQDKLKKLINSSYEDCIRMLENTEFGAMLTKYSDELSKKGSFIDMEAEFEKFHLNKAMRHLHQYPLSVDTILGYMFAKEVEVKNLKMIVKGKQLGVPDEFLQKQLVIGNV
jgi:V/A-type H+-transporting ATPase subunit C